MSKLETLSIGTLSLLLSFYYADFLKLDRFYDFDMFSI